MKLLVISQCYPMPDRSSGDLRFYQLLKILARDHEVRFCARSDLGWQESFFGEATIRKYEEGLTNAGIGIELDEPLAAIQNSVYDAVLFEFYHSAESLLDDVRFSRPEARVVVDSVDVAYDRLLSKARLTGIPADLDAANAVKRTELEIYAKADLVIAVTDDDKKLLLTESPALHVEVVPNIHEVPPLDDAALRSPNTLVFVGSFLHEPNIDAMLYFCNDVFPLIVQKVPNVRVKIIGSSPTPAIKDLARDGIEVIGFVPDVKPYLESSYVSIAPLRYGSGIKGKIGEAMAYGLPVVTTTIGIQGFGLTPSKDVLVSDTAEGFAQLTCDLLQDPALYQAIRSNGWSFIRERFTGEKIAKDVGGIFSRLSDIRPKRLALGKYLRRALPQQLNRHVLWRFKGMFGTGASGQ